VIPDRILQHVAPDERRKREHERQPEFVAEHRDAVAGVFIVTGVFVVTGVRGTDATVDMPRVRGVSGMVVMRRVTPPRVRFGMGRLGAHSVCALA
jgi:hypothetical protein